MSVMNNKSIPDIKKYFKTIDDNSLQAFNTIYEDYKKYSSLSTHYSYIQSLLVKDFFKAEYIKRNYYLNLSKNEVNDIRELSLFTLLSKWRDKREERIKTGKRPPDCNLSNCYFSEKRPNTSINMRPPFFYNTACLPPLQDSYDPNDYCAFKTDIFFSILVLHNEKYPNFLTRINDIRLSNPNSYPFYNSSTDSWSIEFKSIIESLHRISFETGLLIFDLFGLASPEKLLSDSCENKSSISDEIVKLPRAEFFLKADPGGHENGQGFSDKLHDPQNMGVLKKDPEKKNIDPVFIKQLSQKFEFLIGIEGDITSKDFSIKKEVLRIQKAIEKYNSSKKYYYSPLNYHEKCIVFAFNPSASSFNAKKCIEDVRIIIKSYRTALMPFDVQLDYFQDEISDVYERIQSVKNYQENNRSRTIGLYIWDQVHFLNKPINEAIHHFVESNLYLKIMKLSNNEIKVREYKSASKTRTEYKGTQEEYNEVYRNYQYANCCIEHAEILTGAQCEKLIQPKK